LTRYATPKERSRPAVWGKKQLRDTKVMFKPACRFYSQKRRKEGPSKQQVRAAHVPKGGAKQAGATARSIGFAYMGEKEA